MSKLEPANKVPGSANDPQLTAFTGVGEVESRVSTSNFSRDECAKIISDLNHEAANYYMLATALGTKTDGDLLRRRLRLSRVRAWDHAKHAQHKLIPVLRRNMIRSECSEELERMYRAFSACLEFLEQQYLTTLLLQDNFSCLHKEERCFINSGLSELPVSKKCHDKLVVSNLPGTDIISVKSFGSSDIRNSDTADEYQVIQKEIEDLHELIYSMNQSIAIQAWEIDPDIETEKFTIAIDNETSVAESTTNTETFNENYRLSLRYWLDPDNRKIRCVSIVIVIIMLIIVGGIVGILMGLLDK